MGDGFIGGIGGGEEEGWHVEVGDAPAESGKRGATSDADERCDEEGRSGFVGHGVLA